MLKLRTGDHWEHELELHRKPLRLRANMKSSLVLSMFINTLTPQVIPRQLLTSLPNILELGAITNLDMESSVRTAKIPNLNSP